MYVLPDGMSIKQFTNHPVRQAIRLAAYVGERGVPIRAELDSLKLPPSMRARVDKACREVASIHDSGAQSDAWSRGDELASEIIGALPQDMRDPTWWQELPPAETDPAALAGLIPRGVS